ncbi:MAG: PIN domain-containing protein [Deltaproteobacteria bacterium]|nr:PIN domain-containing protein [Deltaproteobacteria bacterium]
MESKRWQVFLDTSALIAGVISPTGAAREVLRLGEARVIAIVLSRQVLTEADRNILSKLPTVLSEYRAFLRRLAPHVVEDPSPEAVREATRVIHRKDAPILAAARQAEVDYLVSWNTRHFHTDAVRAFVRFPVLTPGEFLRAFRHILATA